MKNYKYNILIIVAILSIFIQAMFPKTSFGEKGAPVVVLFGGDLIASSGVLKKDTLASQLKAKYEKQNYYVEFINSGFVNLSTKNALHIIDQAVLDYNPDIVLIELGVADFNKKIEIEQIRFNIETILWKIRKKTPDTKMVLIGSNMKSGNKKYDTLYKKLFIALASKYQIPLYSNFLKGVSNDATYVQANFFHPNARGIKRIMENLTPYYDSYIKEVYLAE